LKQKMMLTEYEEEGKKSQTKTLKLYSMVSLC